VKVLIILLLGLGLFVAGFQIRDYLLLEQAASKAKQDMRDAFNLGVIEGRDAKGQRGGYWPREATIPVGVLRNFPAIGSDIKINIGSSPEQVILYCRPVYGRDLLVVLYDNGAIGEIVGAPPRFIETDI
jgi:hypothetical protein